ncbi:MAG: DUF3352 domain-containing protein [Spirochaetota bacterium]|nr:DUF3352 domain-containing protein [Spirochaetota bacterium]
MKKYFAVFIFIMVFATKSLFAASQYAPQQSQLYVDFSILNLDGNIRQIAGKFMAPKAFNEEYSSFKTQMKAAIGVDLTSQRSLFNVGLDNRRRSAFVLINMDFMMPSFFFVAASTNSIKSSNFFIKMYKSSTPDHKIRYVRHYNRVITIIQKRVMSWDKENQDPPKYKDDFAIVADGYYVVISNNVESVKLALQASRTGRNLARTRDFILATRAINQKVQMFYMYMNGSLIDSLQKMASEFSKQKTTSKMIGLYKNIGMGIKVNGKEIVIDAKSQANPRHPYFRHAVKIYKPKPPKFDLFDYMPGQKPYAVMKASMDTRTYLNVFFPDTLPDIYKEFNREMNQLSKSINFDLKTNVLDNLGNHYYLALYDYDASSQSGSRKFMKHLDFLGYAEVQNQAKLNKSINVLITQAKKDIARRKSKRDKVLKEKIAGVPFHVITDGEISVYMGSYLGHFIMGTKKKRVSALIFNVARRRKAFAYYNNILNRKLNYHFFLDFQTMVKNRKVPVELKGINWASLRYFHAYGNNWGTYFNFTLRLAFM